MFHTSNVSCFPTYDMSYVYENEWKISMLKGMEIIDL